MSEIYFAIVTAPLLWLGVGPEVGPKLDWLEFNDYWQAQSGYRPASEG